MGSAPADPYLLVQDDIQRLVDKVQSKFLRWQGLSKASPERLRLTDTIEEECQSIAWQVQEVAKSVEVASRNPTRFNLGISEVEDRKRWVSNTSRENSHPLHVRMRAPSALKNGWAPGACGHMSDIQVQQMLSAVEAAKHLAYRSPTARSSASAKLGSVVERENDAFLSSEGERTQMLMARQDEELDTMGNHVLRIGEISMAMAQELREQDVILDDLDRETDGVGARLAAAQKKLSNVLSKLSQRGQMCLMLVLIVAVVVLSLFAFGVI